MLSKTASLPVTSNFANGQMMPSSDGRTFDVINPADNQLVGKAQLSSVEDAKMVIDLAYECRERQKWESNHKARMTAILRWADLLHAERESLARVLTLENGKPLKQAQAEVDNSIDHLRYYAGFARTIYGRSMGLTDASFSVLIREPMGVVGHIVPWNYPLVLLFRSLAASLAAGNVAIVKPASYTPLTTFRMVELAQKVPEFLPGALNFVTGPGNVVGAEICRNSKVDMVALTGDTLTGKAILRLAAENIKKVSLELGGKSPNIVFPDADFDKAMGGAITGAFTAAGQICFAASRLLVERSIHDRFVRLMKEKAESMKVGNGLDDKTDIGPIITKGQTDRVMEYIEGGRKEAKLVTGGNRLTQGELSRGNFIAPTIFDDVPTKSPIAQEEIFGPVVSVFEFSTEEEAATLANNTQYGLSAALWTNDVNRVFRLARRIRAGTVWVNTYGKTFAETEFGGYKQSGIGRERGIDGLREFTQLKNVYFELAKA